MLRILTTFAIIFAFSTPALSQTTIIPTPTPTTPPLLCPDATYQACLQLYNDNLTSYANSNFSQVFEQICEISRPMHSQLCAYTRYLVNCITNGISSLIMPGVCSRNFDAEAGGILLDCAANTTSIPNNGVVLSSFADGVNSIQFYGYYINQGLFSNIPILANLSTMVLREINSLCVSESANSLITDASSLAAYIDQLGVSNLTEITCLRFCPECATRHISTSGDQIVSVQQLCLSVSNTSLVTNCLCGNSVGDVGEVCDDGNRNDTDGCNSECLVVDGWSCEECVFPTSCSLCGNGILESGEQCDHTSLGCDNTTCMVMDLHNCLSYDDAIGYNNCIPVVLDTNTTDPGSVNSFYSTSENTFLLSSDIFSVRNFGEVESVEYTLIFSKIDNPDINPPSNPVSVNLIRLAENLGQTSLELMPTLMVTEGDQFITTFSISDPLTFGANVNFRIALLMLINATEVTLTDRPVGSQVRVDIRIMSVLSQQESGSEESGNASIYITSTGTDDTPPLITLPSYSPIFTEGDISIPIVHPLSTVVDVNDRLYLIQSLVVILADTRDNGFESISVQNLSNSFTAGYNASTLTLTISGPGTSENYTDILRSILYTNSAPEPTTRERRFFITARDTLQASETVIQSLSVVNTNDLPVIALSRVQVPFVENSSPLVLDGNVVLSDEDPEAFIQYASVRLVPLDASSEVLSFPVGTSSILAVNDTFLEANASLDIETVQQLFRVVTYVHLSDNPTGGPRTVVFTVIDDWDGITSVELTVDVQAVDDEHVVTLSQDSITYLEDSSPVLLGNLITLSDVDSANFTRMTFVISNIPQSNFFDNDLVFEGIPSLLLSRRNDFVNNIFTTTFMLRNNRAISEYQTVTDTVRYTNAFEGDFADIVGTRLLTITAFDVDDSPSQPVVLTILITVRNDPPLLDIGSGLGLNWTFYFTEFNSSSMEDPSNEEHIVLQPFLQIYDEENDLISSLSVTLAISNGALDPNEFLFVRSTNLALFDNSTNIKTYSTGAYMLFTGEGSYQNYTDILRGLYYTNDEDEPTLFPDGDRFVLITITDTRNASSSVYSIINTIPINDNKPIVFVRLHPGQTVDCERRRREIAAFDKLNLTASITIRAPSSNSNLTPGDVVEIKFEDEIVQKNLAHRKQLESLLHFNQDVYNQLPKYSYWRDAKTLTILFPRIDQRYLSDISEIQKFNLSIIFRDCNFPYKECTNLCAKKTPFACAKGEQTVIPLFSNPGLNAEKLHPTPPLEFQWSIPVAIVMLFFAFIWILRNARKILDTNTKTKNKTQPKSDRQKIQKGKKYKSNPRATPNIFKCNLEEK